jgi:hypothetical protein
LNDDIDEQKYGSKSKCPESSMGSHLTVLSHEAQYESEAEATQHMIENRIERDSETRHEPLGILDKHKNENKANIAPNSALSYPHEIEPETIPHISEVTDNIDDSANTAKFITTGCKFEGDPSFVTNDSPPSPSQSITSNNRQERSDPIVLEEQADRSEHSEQNQNMHVLVSANVKTSDPQDNFPHTSTNDSYSDGSGDQDVGNSVVLYENDLTVEELADNEQTESARDCCVEEYNEGIVEESEESSCLTRNDQSSSDISFAKRENVNHWISHFSQKLQAFKNTSIQTRQNEQTLTFGISQINSTKYSGIQNTEMPPAAAVIQRQTTIRSFSCQGANVQMHSTTTGFGFCFVNHAQHNPISTQNFPTGFLSSSTDITIGDGRGPGWPFSTAPECPSTITNNAGLWIQH